MAKTAKRRYDRYVKGMRRIKEDRAQHGEDHSCPCFDTSGKGYTFSMFADTPKRCGKSCCKVRNWAGDTRQEKRAPTVKDWE